jgi:hypothetical protein
MRIQEAAAGCSEAKAMDAVDFSVGCGPCFSAAGNFVLATLKKEERRWSSLRGLGGARL